MRYHRTFGLDIEQLDALEKCIEEILPEPWNKGTGRPKSLSLREAIMVALLYKRQNITEEVIADLFGISQGVVSGIIKDFDPLITQATEEFVPDAEEAKEMTRGRLALVDGTLWPCWSWKIAPELWAGKYKTTGYGSLIISDEFGNIIFVSDPAPGCDHDMKKLEGTVKAILDLAGSVIADKGFQGSGYVTPAKKPKDRDLYMREHEYNERYSKPHVISTFAFLPCAVSGANTRDLWHAGLHEAVIWDFALVWTRRGLPVRVGCRSPPLSGSPCAFLSA